MKKTKQWQKWKKKCGNEWNSDKMNEKVRKWCYILRIPILLIVYFIFLIIGAGIIQSIESRQDKDVRNNERSQLLLVLKKYNISARDPKIKEILRAAFNAIRVDALKLDKIDNELDGRWEFTNSLFFIGTLVTTIGMIVLVFISIKIHKTCQPLFIFFWRV